jgi:hypothetical protein
MYAPQLRVFPKIFKLGELVSFSAFKRLKIYVRNSQSQDGLPSLALMNTEMNCSPSPAFWRRLLICLPTKTEEAS